MKGKSRVKQPVEIYSKMYYTSQVKPDMPCDSKDSSISNLPDQIEKKFRAEPQEIRDEVMRVHDEQSSTSKNSTSIAEDDEETYPDDTCKRYMKCHTWSIATALIKFLFSNIQQCAPALQQILTHFSRKTGWSFSILMGGPDPTDPEGQCVVAR